MEILTRLNNHMIEYELKTTDGKKNAYGDIFFHFKCQY